VSDDSATGLSNLTTQLVIDVVDLNDF